MEIDTISIQDDGKIENALNLTAEELAMRKIVYIDFVNDPIPSSDYDAKIDPGKIHFESDEISRSPLSKDWLNNLKKTQIPVMCCYKVVKSSFNYWLIQGQVEKVIQSYSQRIFLIFHRTLYCSFDIWNKLSLEELKKLEEELKNSLGQIMSEGQKAGIM